jgi:hypothetical protein
LVILTLRVSDNLPSIYEDLAFAVPIGSSSGSV